MDAVADTGNELLVGQPFFHGLERDGVEIGVFRILGKRIVQHFRAVFRRAEMHAAGAEYCRCHRALNRFRRRMKRHTRCRRAGGHAVVDEDDQHGVDHAPLLGRWHAPFEHQINHLRKRDLAEQLLIEIVAAHEDPIELGPAHR